MTNTNVNAGGGEIVSKCIGTVFIQSCDFPDVILKCDNVLFLPDCAKKLIPVSVFLKKQCSVLYSNDPDPNRAVVVKDNNDAPILAGKAADGLYMFHCDAINRTATSHSNPKSKNNAVAMFGIPVGQKMSANSTDFAQRLMEIHSSFGHLHFAQTSKKGGQPKLCSLHNWEVPPRCKKHQSVREVNPSVPSDVDGHRIHPKQRVHVPALFG